MFVDDIAVRAPTKESLLHTLDTLHEVAYTMGLRFNKDKTEVYHWAKDYNQEPITWEHQLIPVRPPILTYLGHVLAHPTQEDTAWDMVTTQLHHDIAAYSTLPFNAYEKVVIINAVKTSSLDGPTGGYSSKTEHRRLYGTTYCYITSGTHPG